jgi:hypothetical protein
VVLFEMVTGRQRRRLEQHRQRYTPAISALQWLEDQRAGKPVVVGQGVVDRF